MEILDDNANRPTVLLVDDTPINLTLMSSLLKDICRTKVANNGERALAIAEADPKPDLILLDIMMPGIDGYEICRRLKKSSATRDIPVIFLTAKTATADEQQGFDVGAVDYITKPVSPPIVKARVKTHLTLKAAGDFLRDKNAYLEQEVGRRVREVIVIQDVIIMAMASLAETRDNQTGNHIRRTQNYVKALARKLNDHPRYRDELNDEAIEKIYRSVPIHDIGKSGIPDNILLKPGKLTADEFQVAKRHVNFGRDAILAAEGMLSVQPHLLRYAREIVYSHHEKWDGSGYPEGLAGDAIPVSARLMAIADVYDTVIGKRVYKAAMTHEQAVDAIVKGKGTQFDPDMVEAFADIAEEFRSISKKYADQPADG
jgi:putative two-component system response regulator